MLRPSRASAGRGGAYPAAPSAVPAGSRSALSVGLCAIVPRGGLALPGQTIEMAWRAARRCRLFPPMLQPAATLQAFKNGIECAGFQPGFAQQIVAAVPLLWPAQQRRQDSHGLARAPQAKGHAD